MLINIFHFSLHEKNPIKIKPQEMHKPATGMRAAIGKCRVVEGWFP